MQVLRTDYVKVFYFQGPLFTPPSPSKLAYLLEDSNFKKTDFFFFFFYISHTGGRKEELFGHLREGQTRCLQIHPGREPLRESQSTLQPFCTTCLEDARAHQRKAAPGGIKTPFVRQCPCTRGCGFSHTAGLRVGGQGAGFLAPPREGRLPSPFPARAGMRTGLQAFTKPAGHPPRAPGLASTAVKWHSWRNLNSTHCAHLPSQRPF